MRQAEGPPCAWALHSPRTSRTPSDERSGSPGIQPPARPARCGLSILDKKAPPIPEDGGEQPDKCRRVFLAVKERSRKRAADLPAAAAPPRSAGRTFRRAREHGGARRSREQSARYCLHYRRRPAPNVLDPAPKECARRRRRPRWSGGRASATCSTREFAFGPTPRRDAESATRRPTPYSRLRRSRCPRRS